MNFGNNLKEIRKTKGLKQKDMCLALCISPNGYASWEQNRTEPNIEYIIKLSQIFNVTTDFLLGLENEAGCKIPQPFIDNSQFKNANLGNNRGTITINTNNKD